MTGGGVADNLGMLTYVTVYAALSQLSAPCHKAILHTRVHEGSAVSTTVDSVKRVSVLCGGPASIRPPCIRQKLLGSGFMMAALWQESRAIDSCEWNVYE